MRVPPLWLLALALAAFTVQTDDFVLLGVLPAMAEDLRVAEAAVGSLVTVYSLTYALTAPIWALLLARVPARHALLGGLAVFVPANLVVPMVETYAWLLALRIIAATSAAVILPAALAAAGTRAPAALRGRYLATVATGLTAAILVGVPLGTWMGALLGWRSTFVLCGLLGALALLLIARGLPASPPDEPGTGRTLLALLRPLMTPAVTALLAITATAVAGNLAFQTYLAPFLADTAEVTPYALAVLLVLSGVGGVAGTQGAGRAVDRWGSLRVLATALVVFCVSLTALAVLWFLRPVPMALVAVLLVCWSASAWAIPPSLQTLVLDRVGERAAGRALALQSSAVHLGAALGAFLGGAVISVSVGAPPLLGVCSAGLALGLALLTARPGRRRPLPVDG